MIGIVSIRIGRATYDTLGQKPLAAARPLTSIVEHIAVEGTLKSQKWWDHEIVNSYKNTAAKYGCKKGNLPVAVYWYQKFEEDRPGYMPTGLLISILGCSFEVVHLIAVLCVCKFRVSSLTLF